MAASLLRRIPGAPNLYDLELLELRRLLAGISVEEGDLLVGTTTDGTTGHIQRIRPGGGTETYAQSVEGQSQTNFFGKPDDIIVDSQGRVVVLARLGGFNAEFGVFRIASPGAPIERLGSFSSSPKPGWPSALGQSFSDVGGLFLDKTIGASVDDSHISGGIEEGYSVMVGTRNQTNDLTNVRIVRYRLSTNEWDVVQTLPGIERGGISDAHATLTSTYVVHELGSVVRIAKGIKLGASGSIFGIPFSLSFGLFGGERRFPTGTIMDDREQPNFPSACIPQKPYSLSMAEAGPPSGFKKVVRDSLCGLVITSNAGNLGPFLTSVSEVFLNDDPGDDQPSYFLNSNLGCSLTPFVGFNRSLPFFDPGSGAANLPRNINVGPGGIYGTTDDGRVVRFSSGGLQTVGNAFQPNGIAVYRGPTIEPEEPFEDGALFFRIDASVETLLTDPLGRMIGVDPITGQFVNTFDGDAHDTGPGEAVRFYVIRGPAIGDYEVRTKSPTNGPFALNAVAISVGDEDRPAARTVGQATAGAIYRNDFELAADGTTSFDDVTPPQVISPPNFMVDDVPDFGAPLIQLRFSELVRNYFSAGDIVLENRTTGATISPSEMSVDYQPFTNIARVGFPGAPQSLPDGNYRATFLANRITDAAALPLPSDVVYDFFILGGDANRDRMTNIADFSRLATNFNKPGVFSDGDFNYSGTIEIGDFAILASKFNTSLPAPSDLQRRGADSGETSAARSPIALQSRGFSDERLIDLLTDPA